MHTEALKESVLNPPKFDEDDLNFNLWKCRMSLFLKVAHSGFPNLIKYGPEIYTCHELDAKVRHIIAESLPNHVFLSVVNCSTAKDMWDTLCLMYEGTEDVKKIKKNNLNIQYELFHAKKGESITDTYNRFNRLLYDLRVFRIVKGNKDVLDKFMNALPDHWNRVIACLRMNDSFEKMSLQALYGTLLCHEQIEAQKICHEQIEAQKNE